MSLVRQRGDQVFDIRHDRAALINELRDCRRRRGLLAGSFDCICFLGCFAAQTADLTGNRQVLAQHLHVYRFG
ncbi:hypothetical protein D3C86_2109980 [compost metagenome]